MKSLRIAVAALGLFATAFAAQVSAVPLPFNFGVHFTTGPLSGQTSFGTITTDSNDCPANVCSGIFEPDLAARTLLSFNITVGGIAFSASSDGGFPAFPRVGFDATGHFASIDFDGVVAGNELAIVGSFNSNIPPVVTFDPLVGLTSVGAAVVPEPCTLLLLAGGLLAVFGFSKRPRNSARRGLAA